MTRRNLVAALAVICGALSLFFGYRTVRARFAADSPSTSDPRQAGTKGHHARRQGSGQAGFDDSAPSVRVRGTVIEAGTTRGVGGGEVVFKGPRGETTARADGDGHYEVFVPPGAYHPFVRGAGFATVAPRIRDRLASPPRLPTERTSSSDLAPLVLVTEDESGVDLQVSSSVLVTGHVANRSGQPIAQAIVRARGAERPVLGTDVAETDADGAFTLELTSGNYSLDATHPDYAGLADSHATIAINAPDRPPPMSLTLVAGCIVTGRVIGADGVPADAGSIDHKAAGMGDFVPAASIEKDGTFRFTTTDPGEVSLRAWPWMSPPSASETFDCTDGARLETTLQLPGTDADLDGTLVSADGAPVPFAFLDILALTPGGVSQEERTNGKGEWGVFTMPPGDYLVTAAVPGEGFVERRVTVPSHEIDLALGGTGAITGTASGIADGTVSVTVSQCANHPAVYVPSQPDTRLVPIHDGRFRIEGVSACEVSVSARAGENIVSAQTAVKSRHDASVSLDFAPKPVAVIDPPAIEIPPSIEPPPAVEPPVAIDDPAPEPESHAVENEGEEPAEGTTEE